MAGQGHLWSLNATDGEHRCLHAGCSARRKGRSFFVGAQRVDRSPPCTKLAPPEFCAACPHYRHSGVCGGRGCSCVADAASVPAQHTKRCKPHRCVCPKPPSEHLRISVSVVEVAMNGNVLARNLTVEAEGDVAEVAASLVGQVLWPVAKAQAHQRRGLPRRGTR